MPTVAAVAASTDLIFSVCPPHAARAVADQVAAAGFTGVYVDANAVSPSTAREVGRVVTIAGASFVDGGIVGGPPTPGTSTRLYLAGNRAPAVAELFTGTPLGAIVLDGEPGAASALKVCYAAYTKGTTALLLAIRALARAEGVDDALLAEWAVSQPDLVTRSEAGPRGARGKRGGSQARWTRSPTPSPTRASRTASTGVPRRRIAGSTGSRTRPNRRHSPI